MNEKVIVAKNLIKSYSNGLLALNDISLEVYKGKVLVIMGPSGSGKSTLIRTFNGLERLDSGELNVLGININSEYDQRKINNIRKKVGMVFQQFNLFPHLSILENITLAPIHVQKQTPTQQGQEVLPFVQSYTGDFVQGIDGTPLVGSASEKDLQEEIKRIKKLLL